MAKLDDAPQDKDAPAKEEGGKGKTGLILILLGVNILLMLGMGAYFVFFNKPAPAPAADPAAASPTAEGQPAPPAQVKTGPMVELEPFLVNLDEPGASRYLKAMIQLELSDPKAADEVKQRLVPLKDMIITYLSSLNYSQTQGVVNKEIIRTSLVKQINKVMTTGQVTNLYFTDFVIQ